MYVIELPNPYAFDLGGSFCRFGLPPFYVMLVFFVFSVTSSQKQKLNHQGAAIIRQSLWLSKASFQSISTNRSPDRLFQQQTNMTDIFKGVNTIFQSSQVGADSSDESSVASESNKTENEVERVKNLVSEEAFRVRFGRMLVFLTLLGTGTVVCVLVYAVLLFQNESDIADEVRKTTKSTNRGVSRRVAHHLCATTFLK